MVYNAENVSLTHVIKAKIEVEELRQSDENAKCAFCKSDATKYCENCQAYYCDTCNDLAHAGDDIETVDDLGRIINKLRTNHNVVNIQDASPYRFGKCKNHRNR